MSWLQEIWFVIIAFLLVGYTILDGYDLGVGFWHLFTGVAAERRMLLSAIGPFWDGNEVWLITAGGALFAAFPMVYATVFSGMYLALMLVLAGLIVRAVSIDLGAKAAQTPGRSGWDWGFALGSIAAILLFGVAFGNILRGLALDDAGNYTGSFFDLLNPFALLVGVLNLAMLATHGGAYIRLKTSGEISARAKRWTQLAMSIYLPLALLTIIVGYAAQPHLRVNYNAAPALWLLPILALLAIVLVGVYNARGKERQAFLASSLSIALLMASAAVALFPCLVPALAGPELNAANASSSERTLLIMFIIVLIGMPVVLGYSIWVHRLFGGKVTEELHY